MTASDRESPRTAAVSNDEPLPALIGRLGDDLTTLVDTKLSLLTMEMKEEVDAYLRGSVRLAAGGAVAAAGIGLVCVAAALAFAWLLRVTVHLEPPGSYAAGFGLVGILFLVGGLLVARQAMRRLAQTDTVPKRSIHELKKDRVWLSSGTST